MVKTDTLRTASCIRQGLVFTGLLYCQPEDAALLQQALLGVKWVGTMRSRGFGRVRVTGAVKQDDAAAGGKDDAQKKNCFPAPPPEGAACICYRLHTDSPVLATDMARSWGNSLETLYCIPGTAIRGALINRLIAEKPDAKNEAASGFLWELLSDSVRFSDAFPTIQRKVDVTVQPIKGTF